MPKTVDVHKLAEKGKVNELQQALHDNLDLLNQSQKPLGFTPLISAARCDQPGVIELLLKQGANVNATDKDGDTAVHWAAFKCSAKALRVLLNYPGVQVNAQGNARLTPLMQACQYGDIECVRMLVTAGADLTVRNVDGRTAEELAVMKGKKKIVSFLQQQNQTAQVASSVASDSNVGTRPSFTLGASKSAGESSGTSFLQPDAMFHTLGKSFSSSNLYSMESNSYSSTSHIIQTASCSASKSHTCSQTQESAPVIKVFESAPGAHEFNAADSGGTFSDFRLKHSGFATRTGGLSSFETSRLGMKSSCSSSNLEDEFGKEFFSQMKNPSRERDNGDRNTHIIRDNDAPIRNTVSFIRHAKGETPDKDQTSAAAEQGPASDIFLSYQWDHQEAVLKLFNHLTTLGYSCWMDIYQIKPGDDLQVKMQRGVRNANVILSFLSRKYLASKNCAHEISFADEFEKTIVPVRLENVQRADFPDGIFRAAMPARLIYIDLLELGQDPQACDLAKVPGIEKLQEAIKKSIPNATASKNASTLKGDLQILIDPSDIDYELEKGTRNRFRIGSGGFAQVYKCSYKKYNVPAAVKLLHEGTPLPSNVRRLMESEAKKMMHIRSQHVVELYGILQDDNRKEYGIVMEFVPYGSLIDLMDKVLIPNSLKVQMSRDIAFGMTFLHLSCKLLHRDLKAQNILIDQYFAAKISDFGQARFDSATATITKRELTGGSVSHMSPEDLCPRDDYEPTIYTDVWAYGITLFELCADKMTASDSPMKRLPFAECLKPSQITALVGVKRVCPISDKQIQDKIPSDCPPVLLELMKKCCRITMEKRPKFPDILEKLQHGMDACYQQSAQRDTAILKENFKLNTRRS